MDDKRQRVQELAERIIQNTREGIMLKMKYLDLATNNLVLKTNDMITIATDGKQFLYNDYFIINAYKLDINYVNRAYMHSMLHCVLRHMYQSEMVNRTLWDLATDICVENIIIGMNNAILCCGIENREKDIINQLKCDIKHLTAERIYNYFLGNNLSKQKIEEYEQVFTIDNHNLWYIPPKKDEGKSGPGNGNGDGDGNAILSMHTILNSHMSHDEMVRCIRSFNNSTSVVVQTQGDGADDIGMKWQDIAHSMKIDLETFSKSIGTETSDFVDNLNEVTREKYDYTEFLRKFAVRNEVMHINNDEFDYIFYTYGLSLYKNIPLIEPLEYKDVKQIKEFVIAIDTSGSTQGELVKIFLNKTFNILTSVGNIASRTKICVIQCDTEIKDVTVITNQRDIDRYVENLRIRGGGGTNFVPVFRYIDQLIKDKFFTNLKGMIYFTDGYGVYPKKKPNYDVSFVFIEGDDYSDVEVPSWAIKLILSAKDITE